MILLVFLSGNVGVYGLTYALYHPEGTSYRMAETGNMVGLGHITKHLEHDT